MEKESPSENLRLRHMDPTLRSQSRSHSSVESSEQNTQQPPVGKVTRTRVTGHLGFRNTKGGEARKKRNFVNIKNEDFNMKIVSRALLVFGFLQGIFCIS